MEGKRQIGAMSDVQYFDHNKDMFVKVGAVVSNLLDLVDNLIVSISPHYFDHSGQSTGCCLKVLHRKIRGRKRKEKENIVGLFTLLVTTGSLLREIATDFETHTTETETQSLGDAGGNRFAVEHGIPLSQVNLDTSDTRPSHPA